MLAEPSGMLNSPLLASAITDALNSGYAILGVVVGFSFIIFVHELGHFLAAKWMDVRVDRFAVGFLYRVVGWRRGEGITFGPRNYTPEELAAKGYGETDYCLNALPFGGYVKMLGQDDVQINEETGEMKPSTDPRAFTNKSVGRRMVVVSAGVIFNVLFAILVYALVLLVFGREMIAPVIGDVPAGTPEANAGLMPGDRVLSIDGTPVQSWADIATAWVLANKPLHFRIARGDTGGEREFVVEPERTADRDLPNMQPLARAEIGRMPSGTPQPGPADPQPGDRITRVNGVPVEDARQILAAYLRSAGHPLELTVERPPAKAGEKPETITFKRVPLLGIEPTEPEGTDGRRADSSHLLGFIRRQSVDMVMPNGPAATAGFEVGDVIAQWGNVVNPLYNDIKPNIEASRDLPIPVVVERAGQPVSLTVTPRGGFRLFGTAPARIQAGFTPEEQRTIVADVWPDTPAAALGVPRGAEILEVAGRPVHTWSDVYETFLASSGQTVDLRYRTGTDEVTGRLVVPSSIVSELRLPPGTRILKIDGEEKVTLPSGKTAHLPATRAVQELLRKKVGQTVTVEYQPDFLNPALATGKFTVREDNIDPWPLRVGYNYPPQSLALLPVTETVKVTGRPLTALAMGADIALSNVRQAYGMVKNLVTQNMGMQHLAGPVGIVSVAYRQAQAGVPDLLFFLAYMSISLAVLNFLPIPVVDGGLFIFLILEKFRGKPMSLKVQVITTLTGLALIVLCGLAVTIQDVARLFGGA